MTTPVAYFCMEFGLSEEFPIYAGGLGILAGDFIKSAHDLGLPVVGVGLRWARGYSRQRIGEDGLPVVGVPELPRGLPRGHRRPGARPRRDARGRGARLAHRALGQRAALPARAGRRRATPGSRTGSTIRRSTAAWRRRSCSASAACARCASSASTSTPTTSTRGTRSFAGVELIAERMAAGASFADAWDAVREQIVFTTHTPVDAGNEVHALAELRRLGACCELVDWEMRADRRRPVQHDGRRRCGCRAARTPSPSCTARCRARMWRDVERRERRSSPSPTASHVPTWQDARIRDARSGIADGAGRRTPALKRELLDDGRESQRRPRSTRAC